MGQLCDAGCNITFTATNATVSFNNKAKSILNAFKKLHAKLCDAGLRPKLQRLDNECSDALKTFMRQENINYQLAPPGIHRRNAAERAIRTFKNHFIAGLCSTDENFPLHLWDKLLPQAVITLNLLRQSRTKPTMSSWEHFHGPFNHNATPLAPPGIRVLVHEKPSARKTWSPHAVDGWYIGPAMESYRCYKIWIWQTRTERISDTISWFPKDLKAPPATTADRITKSINELTDALHNPNPDTTSPKLSQQQTESLQQLSAILSVVLQDDKNELTETAPEPTNQNSDESLRVPRTETATAAPLRVHINTENTTAAPLRVITNDPTYRSKTGKSTKRKAKTPFPEPATKQPHPAGNAPTSPVQVETITKEMEQPTESEIILEPAAIAFEHTSTHQHDTRFNRRRQITGKALEALQEAFIAHIFAEANLGSAVNPDTGKVAEHAELIQCSQGPEWLGSTGDEIGRLCTGKGPNSDMPTGTETMEFIHKSLIPKGIIPTYLRIVCAWRPEKDNPRRVRFTVGGDRIIYEGDVSTKTSDLTTVKILFNSVISTKGAKFGSIDLKDFYLNTPMTPDQYAYMRIPVKVIPKDIIELYNLTPLIHKDHVYVVIKKGMYGLKQAGRIANNQLTVFLAAHGYRPCSVTAGLWTHDTRPIQFTLVVDDFGVKYINDEDFQHLQDVLRKYYKISVDAKGSKYCGLDIEWDYEKRTCDISMPGYIERALQRFQHPIPDRPQHAPHAWTKPNYGAKIQYSPETDDTPPLDAKDTKRVQEILGTLLYYARAVDSTMLAAIGTLASQQANGTEAAMRALTQLLNYCATHPDATVRFTASDMVLHVESDASYLSETNLDPVLPATIILAPKPSKTARHNTTEPLTYYRSS